MLYRIAPVRGYAKAKAWAETEDQLSRVMASLGEIESGRSRHLFREALRTVDRAPGTPSRVLALSREAAARLAA